MSTLATHTTHTRTSNSSRQQREWVNPLTAALRLAIEPNCETCGILMDSWDMYFDHILFDHQHKINEYRMINERHNRIRHSPLLYKHPASRLHIPRNGSCSPVAPLLASRPLSPMLEE
ncbi:hypothetical protein H4R99_007668 [Coemansia sp. RSA 1722]|nr:hypothetical protein H4R99_007668 [Coemansia sp. RSA 1722]KAJ2596821.1 hypothetical protein GGF39_003293 [Coemansia sp. RSA 1721]